MSITPEFLSLLSARIDAHLVSGDHRLWPGQVQVAVDTSIAFQEMAENLASGELSESGCNGYYVRPTGTGKTVNGVDLTIAANTSTTGEWLLGEEGRQVRTVIMVPWNFLLKQWEEKIFDEDLWHGRIQPEHVGVYRASDSFEKKAAALAKPIVLITYDSARILLTGAAQQDSLEEEETANFSLSEQQRAILAELLKIDNFQLVFLDEVHDRPRGDGTSDFIRRHVFPYALTIGATATHIYKTGFTIGDYLFGGVRPFHETTFHEAVDAGEITPALNIVVHFEVEPLQRRILAQIAEAALERAMQRGANPEDVDYTPGELQRIMDIAKAEEGIIRLVMEGANPYNGRPFREMQQVWFCASVSHARHVARRLNNITGSEDYAVAVYGEMPPEELESGLSRLKLGDVHAVTNMKLLRHALDVPQAELCIQLVPTRAPNIVIQEGGRVMRVARAIPEKIGTVITAVYPGLQQVIFGEIAGGFLILPKSSEIPFSISEGPAPAGRAWPEIEGLRVYGTREEHLIFAEMRRKEERVSGLPEKPRNMFLPEEMAAVLYPKLQGEDLAREAERLQRMVYGPLRHATEIARAQDKFVGVKDAERTKYISARGQRFYVGDLGVYKVDGDEKFCIAKGASIVCRHALYGVLGVRKPEFLSPEQARRILKMDSQSFSSLIEQVTDGFLEKKPYARGVALEGQNGTMAMLPLDTFGFYKIDRNSLEVGLFFDATALQFLYQAAYGISINEAVEWYSGNSTVQAFKSQIWLDKEDVAKVLGVSHLSTRIEDFNELWGQIELLGRVRRGARQGEVSDITIERQEIKISNKITPADGHVHFCVHQDAVPGFRGKLGIEQFLRTPSSQLAHARNSR